MPASKVKYEKFLEELPKENYVVHKAAVKAGFTKSTATKQGKRLLKSALKAKVRDISDSLEGNKEITRKELRRTMAEIVGIGGDELMNTLKKIALQDKDYSSALKVLIPLAKELGVILQDEEKKSTVAVLNVGVREIVTAEAIESPTKE